MKSESSKGPMGWLRPSRAPVSMSAALPVPSMRVKIASLMNGPSMRFTRKPGMSFDSITVLPRSPANARAASWVASLVSRPRMISISPITGTGEKKCRPMKRSGRSVAVASPVMLMLLVLLAKMVSASACWLIAVQVSRLSASSSKIASITMSWPGTPSVPVAVVMRPSVSSAAGCSSLPFVTWRSRLPAMRCRPPSASSALRSASVTLLPAAALTCAMPWPIRPAPITKTRSMPMAG